MTDPNGAPLPVFYQTGNSPGTATGSAADTQAARDAVAYFFQQLLINLQQWAGSQFPLVGALTAFTVGFANIIDAILGTVDNGYIADLPIINDHSASIASLNDTVEALILQGISRKYPSNDTYYPPEGLVSIELIMIGGGGGGGGGRGDGIPANRGGGGGGGGGGEVHTTIPAALLPTTGGAFNPVAITIAGPSEGAHGGSGVTGGTGGPGWGGGNTSFGGLLTAGGGVGGLGGTPSGGVGGGGGAGMIPGGAGGKGGYGVADAGARGVAGGASTSAYDLHGGGGGGGGGGGNNLSGNGIGGNGGQGAISPGGTPGVAGTAPSIVVAAGGGGGGGGNATITGGVGAVPGGGGGGGGENAAGGNGGAGMMWIIEHFS